MKFADISMIYYLGWLIPALVVFYLWALKREKALMEKFAAKELIAQIAPTYDVKTRRVRMILSISAAALIIFAMARPQWGFYWKDDKGKGLDIVIAIDTSKSMLAADMSPDRLTAAKEGVSDFVKRLKGDRVGLIAFSGSSFMQAPLTPDHGGFLLALNSISVETIPRGGTNLPAAIYEAINGYKGAETANKALIVITDGENTEGDVNKAVEKAKKEGVTISCIGIGTSKGEEIPITDEKGHRTPLKDKEGNVVRTKLMEDTLKTVAERTGGIYVRASSEDLGLEKIYEQRLSKLEKKETKDKKVKVYKERFQVPLALALLLLIREFILRGKSASYKV
jgi:Ca-activated chloride channel family protein